MILVSGCGARKDIQWNTARGYYVLFFTRFASYVSAGEEGGEEKRTEWSV